MKGLFIFLVIICILFFITKLVLNVLYRMKKDNYYNNLIVKCFNDYTIVACIILLYAFSISLYLSGDYGIEESNFTLIILVIASGLFIGKKVYLSIKNRGYFYIQSNIYDLNSLVQKPKFADSLKKCNKNEFVLENKEKFEECLVFEETIDSKKAFKRNIISICVFNGLGIIVSIVILVVGLVRGA